jgi:hypothetical protein
MSAGRWECQVLLTFVEGFELALGAFAVDFTSPTFPLHLGLEGLAIGACGFQQVLHLGVVNLDEGEDEVIYRDVLVILFLLKLLGFSEDRVVGLGEGERGLRCRVDDGELC